jgi:hypothetical protein
MYGSARLAREIASLQKGAQRLTELKQFLAESASPSNRRRIAEVDELKRIENRLAELEKNWTRLRVILLRVFRPAGHAF